MTAAVMALAGPALVTSQSSWRPVTAERVLHPEDADWVSFRRTYDGHAYSPLAQINRTNVGQLRSVWSYSVPDNSRWFPTPIVVNGLMYVVEGGGRVLCFSAASGDLVWIHERAYPQDIAVSQGFNRARGLSIYDDVLYWGTADMKLAALDARTGRLLWEVPTGDYRTGAGHNHPPLVADGKVFIGHAGGDRTAAGRFRAYDAKSGRLVWELKTAPEGPQDPGFDTWPQNGKYPIMGAAPWGTITYDSELKLVYFGTGQPEPWTAAARGKGDALFSNSIIAADADTGKMRWYYQPTNQDDWDRDAAYESLLVDVTIGGRVRKALINTGKMGWGVVLDRQTGQFISAFQTAYENVITGWTEQGRAIIDPAKIAATRRRGFGKNFRGLPSRARRAKSSVAELQPGHAPLLSWHQQRLHDRDGRAGRVSTGHRPERREPHGQARPRLRLRWRVRGVRSGHRKTRVDVSLAWRRGHDRIGAGHGRGHRVRRHGGP